MKVIGIIVSVLSTILYSLTYPLQKKVSLNIQPFTLMTISMFFLTIMSLVLSLIFEKSFNFNFSQNKNGILILALVGLINVFAFWFLLTGYRYLPLWQEIMITMLSPIFTAIFAYYILGESFSYKMILGLLIMCTGLYVAVK